MVRQHPLSRTVLRCVPGLLVALAFSSIHSVRAGGITWGAATNISGDTDVSTNGTLFAAYTMGSTTAPPSTTVNGVTFSPFVALGTSSVTVGNVTLSGSATSPVNGHTGIYGSASAPFANLSASYQTLLSSDANTGTPGFGPMTVSIAGLTSGDKYQIEFWVNDSRDGIGNFRTETITGGPTLSYNTAGGSGGGGVGQFVIGTFTAGSTPEAFTLTGNSNGQVNALQVRDLGPSAVPEPASLTLAGLGLALGGATRLVRRCRR